MAPPVTAIVVTRGNVDLEPIVERLRGSSSIRELLVWTNGERVETVFSDYGYDWRPADVVSVYGRYAAIPYAGDDVIYVQDDDALIDADAVVARYEPGRLVANLPRSRWADYPDSTMVGWGAVFDRDLPDRAFERFRSFPRPTFARTGERDRLEARFHRTCDVVFSALTPRTVIDVGFEHLPWAEGPGRMFTTDPARHRAERDEILGLCRRIRGGIDDDRRG